MLVLLRPPRGFGRPRVVVGGSFGADEEDCAWLIRAYGRNTCVPIRQTSNHRRLSHKLSGRAKLFPTVILISGCFCHIPSIGSSPDSTTRFVGLSFSFSSLNCPHLFSLCSFLIFLLLTMLTRSWWYDCGIAIGAETDQAESKLILLLGGNSG